MKKVIPGCLLILCIVACSEILNGQVITTVAGNGVVGSPLGDGGPAVNANIGITAGIAVDNAVNLYIAQGFKYRVREVMSVTGIINTIAGSGISGYSGDNGFASLATLGLPTWVATDWLNNIYITDGDNNCIRKINAVTGIITTIAGNGTAGFSGDEGPATQAQLHAPQGVAVDYIGNVYIADGGNQRLRKVDTAGTIHTVAGTGNIGYSGDGGPATLAEVKGILGICTDAIGNVYMADQADNRVRKIDIATGIINTVAGDGTAAFGGDGTMATSAQLHGPFGVCVDNANNIYIADYSNNRVRKVDASGVITTIVGSGVQGFGGDGGNADTAKLYGPENVVLDSCQNLYIADSKNYRIRKVTFHPDCFPESVKDATTENEISLYPNPAKEQLRVTGGNDVKEVMILNTIGQVLIGQKNYSNKAVIDVSALSRGIYFIKVSGKNGVEVVRRFLKE